MSGSPYREVFTLYLHSNSTRGYVLDNNELGAVTYQVNWDNLFQRRNLLYKSCYVRMRLQGKTDIAKSSVTNATGIVSLIGISSNRTSGNEIPGLIIAPLTFSNSNALSTVETGYYLNTSTTDCLSPAQTSPPQGQTPFTVFMAQEDGSMMVSANLSAYSITLFFELFDPINPSLDR